MEGKQLGLGIIFAFVLGIFLANSIFAAVLPSTANPLAKIDQIGPLEDKGEILPASTRTGEITNPVQTDSFWFDGEGGQAVVICMSNESGDVTPHIFLYDPDGNLEKTGLGYPQACITEHHLKGRTGRYTIVIKDHGGDDTGTYSLSLLLIPGPVVSPTDPDGGRIVSGTVLSGLNFALKADTDAFTFTGLVDHAVTICMNNESGDVTPHIFLYDPDGNLEKTGLGYPQACINGHKLLKSGLYTIVVKDHAGDDTGSYGLSLTKIPPTPVDVYSTRDCAWVPDLNANGSEELALLRLNLNNGHSFVFFKDGTTGELIDHKWCLGKIYDPRSLVLVDDLNGNGHPELAILAVRPGTGTVRVDLRDVVTWGLVGAKRVIFKKDYQPQELTVRADTDGNGAQELAVLGRNLTDKKLRVEIKDALDGKLVNYIFLDREN
ncbi:MAG: hypothetical protein ACLFUU_10745 [Desulfobacteraceae bacterium]